MIIYLAVSDNAISSVLLQEMPEPALVYFISKTLQGSKSRYQLMEKVVFALAHTARRLRRYFQSHRMVVRTDCPMFKILRKPELAGRQRLLKAQVLADFVNEFTTQPQANWDMWNLHIDGSSNQSGSGAGIILEGPNAVTIEQSIRFGFKASNNQAEYEALLAGLKLAKDVGVKHVTCWSDSKIVAEQVNGTYQVKDSVMLQYYQEFKNIEAEFDEICVRYTPRTMNEQADKLAKLASQRKLGQLKSVIHQEVLKPSIAKKECIDIENVPHNWMTPIIQYLTDSSLPNNPESAKKIRMHAAKYFLLGKDLYRRGISTPMLKCLNDGQANYVTREIHEGIYGIHSGGRTMAAKILRVGYYLPTLSQDCHMFTNGQAKAANKVILHELKRRLGSAKEEWVEKLPEVLWAYRCTPQTTTKETPFRLTYGTDIIVPVEIGEPSFQRENFEKSANNEVLAVNLDIIAEVRGQAAIMTEASRRMMVKKFNTKINP
ncbi:uncharacterized protein LOC113871761 [Abrus precatorius]|uniref:Uncharacterized protein LOC113871761 n=1 Tax=Abrus precatorius TaxID=3816 RepID=A0A8B8M814_ABRPR|nr:uncharacterized protein LOC113871761 [Abrus precatorius]